MNHDWSGLGGGVYEGIVHCLYADRAIADFSCVNLYYYPGCCIHYIPKPGIHTCVARNVTHYINPANKASMCSHNSYQLFLIRSYQIVNVVLH